MWFGWGRKNKKAKKGREYEVRTGLPYDWEASKESSPFYTKLIINGILVFMGTYGTILFYTSSFDIPFDEVTVVLVLLLVSFYASFLYYNKWTKNLGYFLLLFLFVGMAILFRTHANSGFSAIYNITYDAIDEILNLPAVRHLGEQVENRYEAISVCLCFLGAVGAILLNTAVSNSMNLGDALLVTFPIMAIGLYFSKVPSAPSVILLSTFYVCLGVLRPSYSINPSPYVRKKKRRIHFAPDGRIMRQVVTICLGLAIILYLFLNLLIPRQTFRTPASWSAYKEKTDEYVENFMVVGFAGLFNRYNAKGGVNGGRLGGVASIRPTFETDLLVRFAPFSADTIYLKAFTGTYYEYDRWDTSSGVTDFSAPLRGAPGEMTANEKLYNAESASLKALSEANDPNTIWGRMEVENVNATPTFPYLPYFSLVTNGNDPSLQCVEGGMVKGSSPKGQTRELEFYQSFDENLRIQDNPHPSPEYFHVPDDLRGALYEFCQGIGLGGSDEQVIGQVIEHFQENYPYSMSPGATPRRKDFVSYFLFENKKGYCAHFASAATLLFRTMDIPARYVEGYAIDYSRVLDGNLVEGESYGDWIRGNAPIGETAVVEATVTDAMAHAWVEVWFEDRGWVPVEVTPSSMSLDEEYSDFWSAFGGLGDGDGLVDNLPVLGEQGRRVVYSSLQFILVAVIAFFLALHALHFVKGYRRTHTKERAVNLGNRYQMLCDTFRLVHGNFTGRYDQASQIGWIRELYGRWKDDGRTPGKGELIPDSSFDEWEMILKKACYSPHSITEEEYGQSVRMIRQMRRLLFSSSSFWGKLKMVFQRRF